MGFHHRINLLFIVFVIKLVCNCFALDLIRKSSRNPQGSLQKGNLNIVNNPNTTNIYNTTDLLIRHPYMKWEGGMNQRNLKMVIVSWRNIQANKMQKNTTAAHQRNKRHVTFVSRHKSQSTTPSYIEFNYFDEINDLTRIQNGTFNRLDRFVTANVIRKPDKFKTSRRPTSFPQSLFSLRLKAPCFQRILVNHRIPSKLKKIQKPLVLNNLKTEIAYKSKYKVRSTEAINYEALRDHNLVTVKEGRKKKGVSRFTFLTTNTASEEHNTPLKLNMFTIMAPPATVSTIQNDRVKFFEIYDNNTLPPPEKGKYLSETDQISTLSDNDASIPRRNSIEDRKNHVNRRHYNKSHAMSYKKKLINFTELRAETDPIIENQRLEYSTTKSLPALVQQKNTSALTKDISMFSKSGFITVKVANWSSYPFASVYVYKPTQTYCDAAAITPHWLVAAGSCVARHRLINTLDERSAFVTYCGQNWQLPERVAYVKSSLVHPKFSPRDDIRRLLYNIGLIQVSSSMASCPGWSPVTMMSRRFTADPAGSMASAVGWGLDRYRWKYSERLPQWPLTEYHALVFSNTCPGCSSCRQNVGADNVYCLLLPPYVREETDPVHGGLLLVGGKLIALYLEEERRSWGAQSAQYTGIWRLVPWLIATAREPFDETAPNVQKSPVFHSI